MSYRSRIVCALTSELFWEWAAPSLFLRDSTGPSCSVCHAAPLPSFTTTAGEGGTPSPSSIHTNLFKKTKSAQLPPVSHVCGPRKQERSLPCVGRPPLLVSSSLDKWRVLPSLAREARTMCAQVFPIGIVSTSLWLLWGTFGLKGNGIPPSIFFLDDRSVIGIKA